MSWFNGAGLRAAIEANRLIDINRRIIREQFRRELWRQCQEKKLGVRYKCGPWTWYWQPDFNFNAQSA